jgi:copper/silver efflux system protein
MIGGMISSTILTLVVIPAVYALVKGLRLPRRPGVEVSEAPPDASRTVPTDRSQAAE